MYEARSSVCLLWNFISVKADVLSCARISQNDCLREDSNYKNENRMNQSQEQKSWNQPMMSIFNQML